MSTNTICHNAAKPHSGGLGYSVVKGPDGDPKVARLNHVIVAVFSA